MRTWPWFAIALFFAGCTGVISAPQRDPKIPAEAVQPRFSCTAGDSPLELPLKRLSRLQYRNTITALVSAFAPQSGAAILATLSPILDQLPRDARVGGPNAKRGGLSRLDQALQQTHVDVTYQLAVTLGAALTSSAQRRGEVFGACATDANTANDAACLDKFVSAFGARATRHPLSADDVAFFETPVGSGSPVDAAVLADVVALILASPGVFYFEEHGVDGASGPRVPLDAFELASRLSYHLWNAPPDDTLWQSAASGALLTDDGYAAEVQRLVNDTRSDASLTEFFGEWLRLYELPALDGQSADPQFRAFAGNDMPDANTTAAMVDDVIAAVIYEARHGGGVSELLNDRRSFAKDPILAAIYGVPAWDGSAAPPLLPASRSGLLTRAAFLATGLARTRPIMKGLFIRTALMCDTVPDPPPGAQQTPPPPLPPVSTTREKVEALTQGAGSSCASCHPSYLNPLGFITESFDALGRARSVETVFDAAGNKLGEKAIHTDAVPRIVASDGKSVKDAVEATARIDVSRKVHSCFSEQYFRFVLARSDDAQADGCALSKLETAAMENKSFADMITTAVGLHEFKTRSFP